MRGGVTAIAALVLLGALWFMVRDDGGRNAAPHLFDNMNERPLADAQQVREPFTPAGRKVRLTPPHAVAQSLGTGEAVRERGNDRDSFAAEGSYFSSGRMQGGEEDIMPLELGGVSRSRDVLAEGRTLYLAHCAVCHGADGNGRGSMAAYDTYPQIGSFRDEKYAAYSPGKMFRSIRLGQGNMPAFGNILKAETFHAGVAAQMFMNGLAQRTCTLAVDEVQRCLPRKHAVVDKTVRFHQGLFHRHAQQVHLHAGCAACRFPHAVRLPARARRINRRFFLLLKFRRCRQFGKRHLRAQNARAHLHKAVLIRPG